MQESDNETTEEYLATYFNTVIVGKQDSNPVVFRQISNHKCL